MKKYPVQLSYIAKSAIWGGTRLAEDWGKTGEGDNIAEAWELSVREKEMSRVLNGEARGMTVAEYIEAVGAEAVGPSYRIGERFPLLVKLIDARDRLSVQVHPDDDYASRVEGDSGKTEMWYIVDAQKDATIVYGLADGVSGEEFARSVADGRIQQSMRTVPVRAGESYFIPAGMVHAIGAGILIAEIQQNSDWTYRVWDYDRRGSDGSLRPLHTEKALDVIRPFSAEEIEAIQFANGREEELLSNSRYFKVRRCEINGTRELVATERSFVSVLCVKGSGTLTFEGEDYPISRGDSYLLPAGMGRCDAGGEMTLICSEI